MLTMTRTLPSASELLVTYYPCTTLLVRHVGRKENSNPAMCLLRFFLPLLCFVLLYRDSPSDTHPPTENTLETLMGPRQTYKEISYVIRYEGEMTRGGNGATEIGGYTSTNDRKRWMCV